MGNIKPWQIVVMVLAVLALVGSLVYSCSGDNDTTVTQADVVRMVDIETGQLIQASYPAKAPVMFPATNPETGKVALYPVREIEGKWRLDMRYMSRIRSHQGLKDGLIVDGKTGEVAPSNPKPVSVKVFGK